VKYELKKRAERQQETRRRIVEAAMALHGELGPARTSISAIAERAGVQRHTVYSHFPEELELLRACSGLDLERTPPPDPELFAQVEAGPDRLRAGLAALYAYYARHEPMLANVLRDLEVDETTRQVAYERLGPFEARLHEVLADGLPGSDAALGVVTSFWSWRTLRDHGLDRAAAAETAATMVLGAVRGGSSGGSTPARGRRPSSSPSGTPRRR
jgi:AcrR family transcriptional regulator